LRFEKLDGCYLTLDLIRGDLIRSGFAEQGLGRRWKEHLRASHLTDRNTKDRPQYQFYPHESVGDDEAPNRRGTVSQLQQKMAMGMRKCDADRILRLFKAVLCSGLGAQQEYHKQPYYYY
jgi:hypothetical protein